MKIYHYTTIDNLALILKNKSIRFNRLDYLDDLEEGAVTSSGLHLGKYVFVSCWTENQEESIPLWKMYTDNGIGVRIALEQNMFKDYYESRVEIEGKIGTGHLCSKLPITEMLNPKYIISPIFETSDFYTKIEYIDNIYEKTKETVQIKDLEKKKTQISIKYEDIGHYKHRRWAFEEESRFVIRMLPRIPNTKLQDINNSLSNALLTGLELDITDYYLYLKENIFDTLEITLSPQLPVSKRIIIESLTNQYAPNAIIKNSILEQSIKLK